MQQDNSSFWTDIRTFEEKLARFPDSFCFAGLSEAYLKGGLADDALRVARQGVAIHPGYIAGRRALAMACHAKGLDDDCIAALSLVTEAMPEDQQSQKLLGRLLADSGNNAAACRVFRTVLEFAPNDVDSSLELESLEASNGSVDPSALEDNVSEYPEEEIIDDIEIIEEIDVLEEELETQTQTGSVPETSHDPLSTATLAELYVKQGFVDKALEILRSILADNPGNIAVSTRIAELEEEDTFSVEPSLADEESEPHKVEVLDFDDDHDLLDNVFAGVKDSGDFSGVPATEVTFPATPVQHGDVEAKSQISANSAISTLEGWRDNVRRIK